MEHRSRSTKHSISKHMEICRKPLLPCIILKKNDFQKSLFFQNLLKIVWEMCKIGWFAYSLQEVFSYFILSPRCLDDGSKVAYGGREGLVTPPDGAKLASRWLQVASRWLQAVPILAFGSHLRSKKPQDDRSLSQDFPKMAHDGPKVAPRRPHDPPPDGSRRPQDVSR